MKTIIERFRGRDGRTELDRRWTARVTDVRNWFVFAASERWREDDTEHEHYSDSGGKSGGQKEKLAYTILAASLAYQFGLGWSEVRSRSFRFVVIDEAFGRGSDDSTQYGLDLFAKLNLQLLIVTRCRRSMSSNPSWPVSGSSTTRTVRRPGCAICRSGSIERRRSGRGSRDELGAEPHPSSRAPDRGVPEHPQLPRLNAIARWHEP